MCISVPIFWKKRKEYKTINVIEWDIFETKVFDLINDYRKELGLKPLLMDDRFYLIAEKRNLANHKLGRPTHVGMRKTNEELLPLGIKYTAENLGWGYTTPEGLVGSWINSDDHHKILTGDWKYTGFKRTVTNKTYFCQIFGK